MEFEFGKRRRKMTLLFVVVGIGRHESDNGFLDDGRSKQTPKRRFYGERKNTDIVVPPISMFFSP